MSNRAERRGQPDVAHEGQVDAGPDGRAVDRGEGGQWRAPDPEEAVVDGPQAGPAILTRLAHEMGQLGAGAESGWGAGDDHGADVRAAVEVVEDRDQLADHLEGQRVAPCRCVEGDGGHPIGDIDGDLGPPSLGPPGVSAPGWRLLGPAGETMPTGASGRGTATAAGGGEVGWPTGSATRAGGYRISCLTFAEHPGPASPPTSRRSACSPSTRITRGRCGTSALDGWAP